MGGVPKVPAKQERVKKQQPTRKTQQYADLCPLLPVLRVGAAIYHTNGAGQRATGNICVTVRVAIKSGRTHKPKRLFYLLETPQMKTRDQAFTGLDGTVGGVLR